MEIVRNAFFVRALALVAYLWWQRSGLVDAQRNRTLVQPEDFHKYHDLVNLGVVGGSSHGDFYYMLKTIWALKIYTGADTVLWATVAASKSNCTTRVPFLHQTCHADPAKMKECTVAMYIGPHGIHLSTQYYKCTS